MQQAERTWGRLDVAFNNAGITGGTLDLVGARHEDMLAITNALAAAGMMIEFHHQGIKDLAPGFAVEARCPEDGSIEAIRRSTDGEVDVVD